MNNEISVVNSPKTTTFQMRINPEVKSRVEEIYSRCGMTLTDAINIFLQQTLNIEGMPLIVTQNSREAIKQQAVSILMAELAKGEASIAEGVISEEDLAAEFGVEL